MTSLPDPAVPAAVYDETYFRTANWGFERWAASDGAEIDPLYAGILRRARLAEGERVVDLGTGRGEMLVAASQAGASSAIGIEYSPAAVAMAEQTIAKHGAPAQVVLSDARRTPLPDGEADLVTMVDVVEHLTRDELDLALTEAHRLLRPGGRIVIHTMPCRYIYDVTYRVQRAARPDRWRRWPREPRQEYELAMHVNEQTPRSLRRSLRRARFDGIDVSCGGFIYTSFVPDVRARQLYHRLASVKVLRSLGAADLWAEARRPG